MTEQLTTYTTSTLVSDQLFPYIDFINRDLKATTCPTQKPLSLTPDE